MSVRRVVFAIDLHGPQDLDALARGRNQQHRMARVRRGVGVGERHRDVERAARIAGAGRPPFLAVERPFVAFEPRVHGDVGRVRRGDARLRHEIGRAGASLEKIRQPARLLLGRAVALEHFHVAGVRSGAVEDLGGEERPAHLFGEIGVFDRREPVALVGAGEPEVPQALGPRLRLQGFADLDHALRWLEAVAFASDLGLVFLLERHDLVAHHRADGGDEGTDFVGRAEIHEAPPLRFADRDMTLKQGARQAGSVRPVRRRSHGAARGSRARF